VVGDLVLQLKQDGYCKLESPWVGPYIVIEVIPGGAYYYKTRKWGKTRATRGMQNNYGGSMHRRSMATRNFQVMTL
jgi:hypothetical protein